MQTNGSVNGSGTVAPASIPAFERDARTGEGTAQNQDSKSAKLVLEPNVPQLIALKYPTGKIVESRYGDTKQVFYSLADGRAAYVSLGVSQSINNLTLPDHLG